MICKNCGAQLEEGSKFCGICGAKVEDNEQVQPVNDVSGDSVVPDLGVQNSEISSLDNNMVMNTEVNSDNDSDFVGKTKRNFVVPIVIIALLLLVIGGIYYFFFNNKSRIVKGLINNSYDKLEGLVFDNKFDIENQSILVNGDLAFSTDIPGLEELSGEKFNYTFGVDYPNKKIELGASLEENELKLVDVAMYLLNDNAYVSLKDDFNKLIKIGDVDLNDIFTASSNSSISDDDVKYIFKAYKNILIDSLDMNDFVKSSATITLDGKDTKVTKLSYDLTSERARELANNIIDGTLKDSKLLEILSKISGTSVDELKSELESSKINGTSSSSEAVTFDIYTKGIDNSFAGMDIQGIIQIRNNKDNVTIEAGMGYQKISLVIKNMSDDSVVIELNSNIGGEVISGSLSITCKEVSTNYYEGSVIFSLSYGSNNISVISNFNEKIGADVANVDVSEAVDYESLNEEEMNKISEKILSRFTDSKFYQLINNFSLPTTEYSESYDYTIDDMDDFDLEDFDLEDLDGMSFDF